METSKEKETKMNRHGNGVVWNGAILTFPPLHPTNWITLHSVFSGHEI